MNTVSARILSALRNDCRVNPEDIVLVGVSGGIDSMFLLHQLNELGQLVVAAVFDHKLRPESAGECDFVENFCADRGIPCVRGQASVQEFAAEHSLGTEAAARELRYRFLFASAVAQGAKYVATAHHANDQAETMLMHILRGSGTDGLSGIRPYALPNAFSASLPLIRPLLGVTRSEIQESAVAAGLRWCEDSSNTDTVYTRNRIRGDLLPRLESEYNPQIVSALCRLAEISANDNEIINLEIDKALKRIRVQSSKDEANWQRQAFFSETEGIRLRILSKIAGMLTDDISEIGFRQLKQADSFLCNARYNQTYFWSAGLILKREGDNFFMILDGADHPSPYPQFSQHWELCTEERRVNVGEIPELIRTAAGHPEIAYLDADRLSGKPYLRKWQPGERFDPCGMGGKTQKLSDFLINNKVPKESRHDFIVAADDIGIIWIPWIRISHRCAITEKTENVLTLKLIRNN